MSELVDKRYGGIQDVAALIVALSMLYLLISRVSALIVLQGTPVFFQNIALLDGDGYFLERIRIGIFIFCIALSAAIYMPIYAARGWIGKKLNFFEKAMQRDDAGGIVIKYKFKFVVIWIVFCLVSWFIAAYADSLITVNYFMLFLCILAVSVIIVLDVFDAVGGYILSLGSVVVIVLFYILVSAANKVDFVSEGKGVMIYSENIDFDGVTVDFAERIGDVLYVVRGNSTSAIPWSRIKMLIK
ncbi:MAG TPA: hypothetical protein VE028_07735 [Nitratidesulfovibrio sp.]|nr:hypothetical protein [Nitratidesulfovibrio sp.]